METHVFPLGRFVVVSSCGRYTAYSEVVDFLDYAHSINVVDHHTGVVHSSRKISMLDSIQFLDTRHGVRLCIVSNAGSIGIYTTDCQVVASFSGSSCTSLNGCIIKLDRGVVTNHTDSRVLDLIPSRACELAVYRTQNSQPLVFTTGTDIRFAESYRGDKIRSLSKLGRRVLNIYVGDTIIACSVLTEEKRRRTCPEEVVILNKRTLKIIKTVPGVLLDVVNDLVFVRDILSSFIKIPGTLVVTSDGREFSIDKTVVAISPTRVVLSQADGQGASIPLKIAYDHEQSAYILRPIEVVIATSPHTLEQYLPPELVAMCM